jgi:DNA polymerase III epsilon subunit-like protein
MRVLVFDTETTGLPGSRIINPDTLKLWPHIVQFSYVIYDTELNDIVKSSDDIVRVKDEITISEESSKIHGITNEISSIKGIRVDLVLNDFFDNLINVDLLVGHNVSFDINMVKVELLRLIYEISSCFSKSEIKKYKYNLHLLTNYKNIYCTMQESIVFCGIKANDKSGKEYNKFPKLLELHQKLFESIPNNLHNSFNDILVTLRCYIKLKHNIDLNEKCDKFIKTSKAIKLF